MFTTTRTARGIGIQSISANNVALSTSNDNGVWTPIAAATRTSTKLRFANEKVVHDGFAYVASIPFDLRVEFADGSVKSFKAGDLFMHGPFKACSPNGTMAASGNASWVGQQASIRDGLVEVTCPRCIGRRG